MQTIKHQFPPPQQQAGTPHTTTQHTPTVVQTQTHAAHTSTQANVQQHHNPPGSQPTPTVQPTASTTGGQVPPQQLGQQPVLTSPLLQGTQTSSLPNTTYPSGFNFCPITGRKLNNSTSTPTPNALIAHAHSTHSSAQSSSSSSSTELRAVSASRKRRKKNKRNQPLRSDIPTNVVTCDAASHYSHTSAIESFATAHTNNQKLRSMSFYVLFGLRLRTGKRGRVKVAPPAVSQQFIDLNGEPTIIKANRFNNMLHPLFTDYERSDLWWQTKVTPWPINGAFVSNMIIGNFKLTTLGENMMSLKTEINLLHFLPPPSESDPDYSAWLLARHRNEKEFTVLGIQFPTNSYKTTSIQSDLFIGGQQQELAHVQTAMSNFVCMLNVIYLTDDDNRDDRPLIIKQLLEILYLSNRLSFRTWYNRSKARYPWIPHMLLIMVHNLIRKHAEIAASYKYQTTHQADGVAGLPSSIFDDAGVTQTFEYVKKAIEEVSNTEIGLHYWSNQPGSWDTIFPSIAAKWNSLAAPAPSVPPSSTATSRSRTQATSSSAIARHSSRNPKKGKDPSSLGWLRSDRVINNFPDGLSRVCPSFAFIGNHCKAENCPRQHLYYVELTKDEKSVAEAYVANTPGLHFNHDLKTCGTPAKPRRFKGP